MAKTELTKQLEKAIWLTTNKMGVFGCHEVTIGWYGSQRVDYMTYDTKGVFRCYEIKTSKEDFRSKHGHNFVGDYNYYVMPQSVYDIVKDEIPKGVGVYIAGNRLCHCAKKAARQTVENKDVLKDSLIRSLCRYATNQIQSDDDLIVDRYKKRVAKLEREKDKYYREAWDLRRKYHPDYAKHYNSDEALID